MFPFPHVQNHNLELTNDDLQRRVDELCSTLAMHKEPEVMTKVGSSPPSPQSDLSFTRSLQHQRLEEEKQVVMIAGFFLHSASLFFIHSISSLMQYLSPQLKMPISLSLSFIIQWGLLPLCL